MDKKLCHSEWGERDPSTIYEGMWRVGCSTLVIIIIITPSFNVALHQAPDGSGLCERGGVLKTARSGGVWWGTPDVNEASSPPLLNAEGASPREDRSSFPCMHAGVLVGPGRERRGISVPPEMWATGTCSPDENRIRDTDVGPGCRADQSRRAPWAKR